MTKYFILAALIILVVIFVYGIGELLILIDEIMYKREKDKHKNESNN